MRRFIRDENIKRYRALLSDPEVVNNPIRHATLVRLLSEEQEKENPQG